MRILILGAVLAACAAPALTTSALAAEANDYLMKAPEGDHPGREYVAHGVRVVEGQPRWAVQNRQVVDERFLVPRYRRDDECHHPRPARRAASPAGLSPGVSVTSAPSTAAF